MTAVLLFLTALLLAYANGANDNFKATATVYGSATLRYRTSLVLATAAQVVGSVASVFLAGELIRAFSGKGLVPDAIVADPTFIVSVGAGAALTVLVATRFGLPISTTHALVGGLVGAGFALAPSGVVVGALGSKYFLPLVTSPLIALVAAAVLYPVMARWRRATGVQEDWCFCIEDRVEPTPQGSGALVLARAGVAVEVAEQATCARRGASTIVGVTAERAVDTLHVGSALALGFARGLNDTPKVFALLVAGTWTGLDARTALFVIAAAMAIGGLVHSRRLAETLGRNLTTMNRGQGLVANVVSSSLVILASLMGSPVSTTHVSTGAIFGIGVWSGRTSWTLASGIVLAWVVTLPLGGAFAYAAAHVVGS